MGAEARQGAVLRFARRQQLNDAIARGEVNSAPRDRFGVPLKIGDYVLFRPFMDPVCQVVDIKPVIDPRAPAGLVTVVLQAVIPMHVPINLPNQQMIALGTQDNPESNGDGPSDPPGDEPPSGNIVLP